MALLTIPPGLCQMGCTVPIWKNYLPKEPLPRSRIRSANQHDVRVYAAANNAKLPSTRRPMEVKNLLGPEGRDRISSCSIDWLSPDIVHTINMDCVSQSFTIRCEMRILRQPIRTSRTRVYWKSPN